MSEWLWLLYYLQEKQTNCLNSHIIIEYQTEGSQLIKTILGMIKIAKDSVIKDMRREIWIRFCWLEPPAAGESLYHLQLPGELEELPLWLWTPPGQWCLDDLSWSRSRPGRLSSSVWISHLSLGTCKQDFKWRKLDVSNVQYYLFPFLSWKMSV